MTWLMLRLQRRRRQLGQPPGRIRRGRRRAGGTSAVRARSTAHATSRPTPSRFGDGAPRCAHPRSAIGTGHGDSRGCRSSESARTRAAASSIASGMPSRRRQMSAMVAKLSTVLRKSGPDPSSTIGEQIDRVVGQRQRWHHPGQLAGDADRLAARRQDRQMRTRIC